jgi:hypothetical protein
MPILGCRIHCDQPPHGGSTHLERAGRSRRSNSPRS